MPRRSFIFTFLVALSFTLIVQGCGVFSAVGDAISSGYENSLTYFNVYYNARRAFSDAETEIKDAAKANAGKTTPGAQPATIPPDAAKNLDLVIDKCSNILAYHSKSAYVDDALMMTGKAFFYKGEYSKAERKFLELITQYPNSPLNLGAQLWYAKSEEKLGEYAESRKNLTGFIPLAEKSGDGDLLAEAYSLMGWIAVHDNTVTPAIEFFQKSANAAESDQLIADAWFEIGQLYFADGEFQNSIDASLKVESHSDDVYQIFQSKLLATRAYRNLQLLDKALVLENDMAKDYRFKDYLGIVLLERANILLAGGRHDDALNIYLALDTTYAHTETGAMADSRLGKYFERTGNNYVKALYFYSRATSVPATSVLDDAAHKVIALNLYFKDQQEISNTDSLMALALKADSAGARRDSLAERGKDTVAVVKDSTKTAIVVPGRTLSKDSLNAIEARAAAGLGELFYTDLANPDSAIYWLRFSLMHQYVEYSAPRILYMLSELASSDSGKTNVTSKEFQAQLIKDFPNSYFSRQLQHLSTDENVKAKVADSAADAYSVADSLIDSGRNEEALAALRLIIARYPTSPVAAKCRYAIGWVYENRLTKMDSAAAEYKLLIKQYPTTPYALAMNARQLDTLATAPVKPETASQQNTPQAAKKDTVQGGQTNALNIKQNSGKPPGVLSRRAQILQSQQGKLKERE